MRLLSFIDGEAGYAALLADAEGAIALRLDGGDVREAHASGAIEEGRARLDGEGGELAVSWSPAGPLIETELGGARVSVHPIAVSGTWDGRPLSGPGVAWELPERLAALRTLWATTAKGGLLLLASVREDAAAEHGEERTAAVRMLPDAEPYAYVEPLLSTEYDADGAHTRATLELWAGTEDHVPERGGGLRAGGGALASRHGRLEAARFDWSLDGSAAVGGYEILSGG